jgi:hypothetical protein
MGADVFRLRNRATAALAPSLAAAGAAMAGAQTHQAKPLRLMVTWNAAIGFAASVHLYSACGISLPVDLNGPQFTQADRA